jgi:hypothetical protein
MRGWTSKQRIDALAEVDAGKTVSEIADAIGRSKNAVLGMVHRVRGDERRKAADAARAAKAAAKAAERAAAAPKPEPPPKPIGRPPLRPKLPPTPIARKYHTVAFSGPKLPRHPTPPAPTLADEPAFGLVAQGDELSVIACRWPYGDPLTEEFRQCGRPQRGPRFYGCYCAVHALKAYTAKGLKDLRSQKSTGSHENGQS